MESFFLGHGVFRDYVDQHTCPFQLAFEIVYASISFVDVLLKLLAILIFLVDVFLEILEFLFAFRRSHRVILGEFLIICNRRHDDDDI